MSFVVLVLVLVRDFIAGVFEDEDEHEDEDESTLHP
jgi:hypothetical protein